jgi:acyl carrier protein
MTGDDKTPNWTVRAAYLPATLVPEHYTGSRDPAEIMQRIQALVAEHMGLSMNDVARVDKLADLGADSLDEIELVMAVEDEFLIEIPDEEAEQMGTLDSAVRVVLTILNRESPF